MKTTKLLPIMAAIAASMGDSPIHQAFVLRPPYGSNKGKRGKTLRPVGRQITTGVDAYGTQYIKKENGQIVRGPKLIGKAREEYRQKYNQ